MKDKLVTLIGGGGFIGRYVAQDLLRAGARVRIAQRNPKQAYFLKPLGGLGQTQFIAIDVARGDTVARAVAGSDVVINLAGTWGDFDAVHVRGAKNVARAAAEAGVTAMVQLSANGADANGPSAYARSKAEGEQRVLAAFPAATILRPTMVFGREDQFTNRFATMVKLPVVPVLRSDARLQPVYVVDVADAVAAVLADAAAHAGRTYELGGPDVMTMRDLIRAVARESGRKPHLVALPDWLGSLVASLPGAPITRDQWQMLARDTVVPENAAGLSALGVASTPFSAVASTWLVRFRRAGRFGHVSDWA